jgi:hypothetical protein
MSKIIVVDLDKFYNFCIDNFFIETIFIEIIFVS